LFSQFSFTTAGACSIFAPNYFSGLVDLCFIHLLSVFELSVPASGLRSPARDFPSDGSQLGLHLHRPSHFSSLFPVSVR
jgi:hypothetical protein